MLFLHYNDMKRDHDGSLRRIADFLGIRHDAAAWARILEYTSFAWMKTHDVKFDGMTTEIPLLKPGAMVRKGAAGAAHEDGMTPALAAEVRAVGESICNDADAIRWFYAGGALP
ncbi:MAG: sulfotransferase domain-containing protein [Proteobacteria bacterium]|nr:sulfotransferase domain-containing protein [Pseudomonadota bacterium]